MTCAATTRWWVPAVVAAALLGGCGGEGEPSRDQSGAIDKASQTRLLKLRAGDCIADLRDSLEHDDGGHNGVPKVTAVKCTAKHDAEVLRVAQLGDRPWPDFPIVDGEAARGRQELQPRLLRAKRAGGPLAIVSFRPTQPRWDFEGQHAIYFIALFDKPQRAPAPK